MYQLSYLAVLCPQLLLLKNNYKYFTASFKETPGDISNKVSLGLILISAYFPDSLRSITPSSANSLQRRSAWNPKNPKGVWTALRLYSLTHSPLRDLRYEIIISRWLIVILLAYYQNSETSELPLLRRSAQLLLYL